MQWYCKITTLKSNLKQNESQKHIFKLPMVFTRYEFTDLQDDISMTQYESLTGELCSEIGIS